ncbi:branched-chain amino acid ABC transporter permease [Actinomadura graeca]|uniref:Branched-chain amino acid ABC transporter permease n=1 Tax=Actinomadura graeca TaxID=2750812 RepID=A0ABX8QX86_9ACTN|nr:branched-chain amino acid ABC transporter permease [Actinomadura graeca]QXJ22599.1 branched-chain amino acid ABC transporter permease [Actinomadura graeca]
MPALLGSTAYIGLLTLAGIWGVAGVGVSLLAGLGGQFTFGQAGLVGIGAYASAVVTAEHGGHPLLGVLAGVVIAVAVALVTAPILRLRGWYLALATLALGHLILHLEVTLTPVTNGNDGISEIPPLGAFGVTLGGETAFFVASWTTVALCMLVGRNLAASRFGRAARAVQADEDAARGLAVPALRYKTAMWVLAAAMAALSGSLYAHYSQFVSPADFGVDHSITLFVAVLLGGYRSVFGTLVALGFLLSLPELGGTLSTPLLTALALMVVYALSPAGLAGLAERAVPAVRRLPKRHGHA